MALEKQQVNIPIAGGSNSDVDEHLLEPPFATLVLDMEADRSGALNKRVDRALTKQLAYRVDTLVSEPQLTALGTDGATFYSTTADKWSAAEDASYRGIHVEKAHDKAAGVFCSVARAGSYICQVESHQTIAETLDGGGGGWYVFQTKQYRWESFYTVYTTDGEIVIPKKRITFNSRDVGMPRVAAINGAHFVITAIESSAQKLYAGAIDMSAASPVLSAGTSVATLTNSWYVFTSNVDGSSGKAYLACSLGNVYTFKYTAGALVVGTVAIPAYVYGTMGPCYGIYYDDIATPRVLVVTSGGYLWSLDVGSEVFTSLSSAAVAWANLVLVGSVYYGTDGSDVTELTSSWTAARTSETAPTAVCGLWTDGTKLWTAVKFPTDSSYSFTYESNNSLYNGPEADNPNNVPGVAICELVTTSVEERNKTTGVFTSASHFFHEVVAVLPVGANACRYSPPSVIPEGTPGKFLLPIGGGYGDTLQDPELATSLYWGHPWTGVTSTANSFQDFDEKSFLPVVFDTEPTRRASAPVLGGTLVSSGLLHMVTPGGIAELSYLPNTGRVVGTYVDPTGYAHVADEYGVGSYHWDVSGQKRRTAGWMYMEYSSDTTDATGYEARLHGGTIPVRLPFMRNNSATTHTYYPEHSPAIAGTQNEFWQTHEAETISAADWARSVASFTIHGAQLPATDSTSYPWLTYASPEDWWAGGELHPQYAPPFHHMASDGRRVYGVNALDRSQLWYSKYAQDGIAPEFHGALVVNFDGDAGDIEGVGVVDSTVYVLTKTRVYRLVGVGADNTGRGSNYDVRLVQTDTGCTNAASIVNTDAGVFFQGVNGFYHIDRSANVQYLGRAVRDVVGTVSSAVLVPDKKQVVWSFSDSAKEIVYNYDKQVWSRTSDYSAAQDMVYSVSEGKVYSLSAVGNVSSNINADTGDPTDGCTYVTSWIKPAGLQGFSRVWFAHILFKATAGSVIGVKLYRDWNTVPEQVLTYTVLAGNENPGQLRIRLNNQKLQSLQIEVTHTDANSSAFTLKGLSLTAGVEPAGQAELIADSKR